jgi:hypothetical protein
MNKNAKAKNAGLTFPLLEGLSSVLSEVNPEEIHHDDDRIIAARLVLRALRGFNA